MMGDRVDSLGRRRKASQDVGRAGLPAAGDGGKNLRCPDYLGTEGRACWEQAVKYLRGKGLLDHADEKCVEMFAAAYEDFRTARDELTANNGPTMWEDTKDGREVLKPHPAVKVMENGWKRCTSLLADMGFSPSARKKFESGDGGGDDELMDFIRN